VRLEPTTDRPALTIATSRYQAREKIVASGLATVGTTVGKPKFPLGYELAGMAWKLAPHGCLHSEDRARFRAACRGRLNRVGVAPIRRLLTGLAQEGGRRASCCSASRTSTSRASPNTASSLSGAHTTEVGFG
jgi:hypothetical protein